MNKKYAIPLILTVLLLVTLSLFGLKESPSFSQYDIKRSSHSRAQNKRERKRVPASISLNEEKKSPRKINQTLTKYKSLKDLPPGLIPLRKIDKLAEKFIPKSKSSLGKNAKLLLEIIPSHYHLDQSIDKSYSIKIRTINKGTPASAQLEVRDEQGEAYPISTLGGGLYQMKVAANQIKSGKTYFNIMAKNSHDEAFASVALEAHSHYFDFIGHQDQGIDAQGNLFFANQFHFYERGNYLIEGVLYHKGKPIAQTSTLLQRVRGEVTANLSFHGYFFYRDKLQGEFQLRGIQVTQVDDSLASSGDQYIEMNQVSTQRHWEDFNSKPHYNEVIHNKINKLTQNFNR